MKHRVALNPLYIWITLAALGCGGAGASTEGDQEGAAGSSNAGGSSSSSGGSGATPAPNGSAGFSNSAGSGKHCQQQRSAHWNHAVRLTDVLGRSVLR